MLTVSLHVVGHRSLKPPSSCQDWIWNLFSPGPLGTPKLCSMAASKMSSLSSEQHLFPTVYKQNNVTDQDVDKVLGLQLFKAWLAWKIENWHSWCLLVKMFWFLISFTTGLFTLKVKSSGMRQSKIGPIGQEKVKDMVFNRTVRNWSNC